LIKSLFHVAIITSTLLMPPTVVADEIVAILDLKFIENTGEPGGYLCIGDEECGVWAVFYLFEASVDKVISGELPEKKFLVLYARHALREKSFRNIVALLKAREPDDFSAASYQITQWGEKRDMYCFSRRDDEDVESDVILNDQYPLNCYDPLDDD